MERNKFTTYLLYAIGEIVLVVIGILIAVSINNWNENRKKANLEDSILLELKDNIIADINDIQADMSVYTKVMNSCEILIDYIDGNISYHDSLNVHLGKISTQGVYIFHKAAYENLKNSGTRLISNDSLRTEITELYEGRYRYVEEYMDTEYQRDREIIGNFYLGEMQEYALYKYAKPVDPNRLLGNQEFRNILVHRRLKLGGWYKSQYELNIRSGRKIIEMIDKELSR